MAYTRKQVVTCISIMYLIFATALAGYASSRANRLAIPIPRVLSGFTAALPILSGILLEAGYDLTRGKERHRHLPRGDTQRPPLVIIANTLIFICSTVVMTLLGTHAAPLSELDCGLKSQWQNMFHKKDSETIRVIQEAFKCCGFVNSRDMAWPFPDKTHDALSCERTFGRTNGCLGPWKREEQSSAGMLMGVVGMVFVWQMLIIVVPTQRDSWLHRIAPDRISRIIDDEEHGNNGPQRAIDYLPNFSRYQDNAAEQVSDSETARGAQRTIENGVQQAKNAHPGRSNEGEPQHANAENEWSRD